MCHCRYGCCRSGRDGTPDRALVSWMIVAPKVKLQRQKLVEAYACWSRLSRPVFYLLLLSFSRSMFYTTIVSFLPGHESTSSSDTSASRHCTIRVSSLSDNVVIVTQQLMNVHGIIFANQLIFFYRQDWRL